MTRQRLRIFVSSPGDVMSAREVAAQVIEKIAHEFARFFVIEPYLWEYEPMLASGHFQDSIDPPSRFDAVILILESRLGTPLPERTAVREYRGIDGRTPVTGTEWEYEDALAAARAHGVPDLLVYRSQRNAEVSTRDSHARKKALEQIEALDTFWTRNFKHEGTFLGAYASFDSLEQLAEKLEAHLRRCIERRIEALQPGETVTGARLWPKAPFRGLEAYEREHASIFFGRDEAVGAALLRMMNNEQAGQAFLLVLGASGSGKSSLVKAGVVPRLLVPQRVSGAAFLRVAQFRASDARADEDLFDAFARCLTEPGGDDGGLPELRSNSSSPGDLAQHLRGAATHPHLPFAMVLDRLGQIAVDQGRMLRYEQAKLLLIVDQLEELFTAERIRGEERARFVQLLAALARSGRVWIVATMRSDFWHRTSEAPELIGLADGGRVDLLRPTAAELSQMIRGPAEAAAIRFETHPVTGIPLSDLIAQEAASGPGVLPLMSYLLDQLFKRDVQEAGGNTLTYKSYEALGGLKGAIATRADAVLQAQPADVQAALRAVLFALVHVSAAEGGVERATARRARLSDFPPGTPKRRLIDALLDPSARLLVADAAGGREATVRLAHEALITEWQAARDYVTRNTEALRSRRSVEERFARWQAIGSQAASAVSIRTLFAREHGLLNDLDLIDARLLLRDYREELPPELVAYIERSRDREARRRRRTVRTASAVAAVMGVLAIGAAYEARIAERQRDAALAAQSRSLTQTAAARLKDGDPSGALSILLHVLPQKRAPGIPYSPQALGVFQVARAADSQILTVAHDRLLFSAAFARDGNRFATASADRTARIWDTATGQLLAVLKGHAREVISADFSPDGKQIVTGSFDHTAKIWDAGTGREITTLKGHTGTVLAVAFSPDSKRVVTASGDKTARVWDVASGQVLVQVKHSALIRHAAFSPDGSRISTASYDNTARIWDAASGKELMVLRGHAGQLWCAAFSPDGKKIVTASFDETARIWDVESGRQLLVLSGHANQVNYAGFSPDGLKVITASDDKTARIWDAETGRQLTVLVGHRDDLETAVFSADGRFMLTSSLDKTARLWSAGSAQQGLQLNGHTSSIGSAHFSPDGTRLVSASFDNTARIWDAATGQQLRVIEGHTGHVERAEFSPDGHSIATVSDDATARVWDASTGAQTALLTHPAKMVGLAYSPDGLHLATSGASGSHGLIIWDIAAARIVAEMNGHSEFIPNVAFSPDGHRIVSASDDKTARIWDSVTGRQLLVLDAHKERVESAAYSPDGKRVATASADKTARIWDAATGQQLLVLSGHTDSVQTARFSPDGSRVVTAGYDRTARIWDSTTGDELGALVGHNDLVEDAEFSPDGQRIATASDDNSVRIWSARTGTLENQIIWTEAAQFDVLSNSEIFDLGIPAPVDVRVWPSDRTRCDEAAAAPYDPERRASGAMQAQIVADIALAACSNDERGSSQPTRKLYQHARAQAAAGKYPEARKEFEEALAHGYAAAGIDLGALLSRPAAAMLDVPRAIGLYQKAWAAGLHFAAFALGDLYEHGVAQGAGTQAVPADPTQAWVWYEKGAAAAEPSALARLGGRDDGKALGAAEPAKQAALLAAFKYYAAAAGLARRADWPDDAWRDWRYRRASLARVLARGGMLDAVAVQYDEVRRGYAGVKAD
jgi:WD40 repeat protein